MPAATATDSRVRRLRLLAPAGEVAAARREIEAADWDITRPGEVVHLRHLRVSARRGEIAAETVRQARLLTAGAADGWSDAADQAPAVRFASASDRMACLLRDLLRGRAEQRWFWRGQGGMAGQTAGEALLRLLREAPLAWPAAALRLEREPEAWQRLWHVLSEAQAGEALGILEQATGWRLVEEARSGGGEGAPGPGDVRGGTLPAAWIDGLTLPEAVRRLSTAAPRLRLAVTTRLWQRSPEALARPSGLTAWMKAAAGGAPGAVAPGDGMERGQPRRPRHSRASGNPEALRSENIREAGAKDWIPACAGMTGGGRGDVGGWDVGTQGAEAERPRDRVDPVSSAAPASSPDFRFLTRQGGWFLLCHLLPLAQDDGLASRLPGRPKNDLAPTGGGSGDFPEPGAQLSGWQSLYRLGRALGLAPDAPLAHYFAAMLGLEDAAELEALPVQPWEEALPERARQRHGEAGLEAALQPLPALVLADASHVDVHFRLRDARLAVRLAGLDVNPGWQPRLGRVLTFHYGAAPELDPLDSTTP